MAWPFLTQFMAQRASKDSIASSFQVSQPEDGFSMINFNHESRCTRWIGGKTCCLCLAISVGLRKKADQSCIFSPSPRLRLQICCHCKWAPRSLGMCVKALHIFKPLKNEELKNSCRILCCLAIEFLDTCRLQIVSNCPLSYQNCHQNSRASTANSCSPHVWEPRPRSSTKNISDTWSQSQPNGNVH